MDWDESHPLFWLDEEEFYGADPRADLDHWSRSPCWTVEEATALSFGKEPRIVNWAFLREFSNHPFAETYRKRLEHGLRATQIGDLGGVNRPVDYIEWAKGIDFEFSPEVENAVRAHQSNVRDWRSDYEALATERDELAAEVKRLKEEVAADALRAKPLLESERESLLIMIAAMAQKGYLYTATGNSSAPTEIADDIVKVGLQLDVKTVRKYLHAAAKLLPHEDRTA